MRRTYFMMRLLAVLLVLAMLFLTGCKDKATETPDTTTVPAETAPTDPTVEPTDPPEPTAHQKLFKYLVEKKGVTTEESTFTFTMTAQNGNIIVEYKNDSTQITITMQDGAQQYPVSVSFGGHLATAVVDVATYSSTNAQLDQFWCGSPTMMEPLRNLATSAVKTCFRQAAKAMEPSGINLVDLGFVNYYQ